MAKNVIFDDGDRLSVICTYPTTPKSGDPVIVGDNPGIANTDERADGTTSVQFKGVVEIPVKGINAGGNSAVAVNDKLYYTDGDTPPVSKKATGVAYGMAIAAVGSGATKTVRVRIGK
jgi:predicted RecA/RadA family phage recombinase